MLEKFNNLKYHKFTLTAPNPPAGYRFLKRGEKCLATDLFYNVYGKSSGDIKSMEFLGEIYINIICGWHSEDENQILRKID